MKIKVSNVEPRLLSGPERFGLTETCLISSCHPPGALWCGGHALPTPDFPVPALRPLPGQRAAAVVGQGRGGDTGRAGAAAKKSDKQKEAGHLRAEVIGPRA